MECIGCKTFHESKTIKPGETRKCFICQKELKKVDYFKDFFNGIF